MSGLINQLAPGWRADGPVDEAPRQFHASMPGYIPTPLHRIGALAEKAGVAEVWLKDESNRLGTPSFKITGTSWGTAAALSQPGAPPVRTFTDLLHLAAARPGVVLAAATDGNHGRALAHLAGLCGLPAKIYIPTPTAPVRVNALREEGAEVIIVAGDYDAAVGRCIEDAAADPSMLIVSDTSWPGYERVPTAVIAGYDTILQEIDTQRGATPEPFDAIIVQLGAGGLAASIVQHYKRGPSAPAIITVEPARADCALQAAQAGHVVHVPGPHPSIMAGLNCGTVSHVAWRSLQRGVDLFLSIQDHYAEEAVRALATAGLTIGETGAAGYAGLLALATSQPSWREAAHIHPQAKVLLIATEGITDPISWHRIVRP